MTDAEQIQELKQRVAFLVAEAHGWQPRLEAAEAALASLRDQLQGRFEQIAELTAERDEARKALNGFVWLNDNIHNYGSSRWLEFWDSAIQDCFAALAKEDTDE